MRFIQKRAFYDHIHEHFKFPQGVTEVMKAESIGSDDEAYLFTHGGRYDRTTRTTKDAGASGVYILYGNSFHLSEAKLVAALEEWYGQAIEEVIGRHTTAHGLEILAKVPYPKDGFWWDREGS